MNGVANHSDRPILVTGARRWGTTWVGHTLALSPDVGYIHEPFHEWNELGFFRCLLSVRQAHEVRPFLEARHPDWTFLRHADVSRKPKRYFEELYRQVGLTLTPALARQIDAYSSGANPVEPAWAGEW